MKLRTKNKIVIGDPQMGADLEIKTNGRAYTIQVLFEKMEFQGMDFGERPALIRAYTTTPKNYKKWEIIGTIGIDSGVAAIWDPEDAEDYENSGVFRWSEWKPGVPVSNRRRKPDSIDGLYTTSGLGDGEYNVYVKRNENEEITDFVIDFHNIYD